MNKKPKIIAAFKATYHPEGIVMEVIFSFMALLVIIIETVVNSLVTFTTVLLWLFHENFLAVYNDNTLCIARNTLSVEVINRSLLAVVCRSSNILDIGSNNQ